MGPHPRESEFIGLSCILNIQTFKTPPEEFKVQPVPQEDTVPRLVWCISIWKPVRHKFSGLPNKDFGDRAKKKIYVFLAFQKILMHVQG